MSQRLDIRGVTKSFGETRALGGVDLGAAPGEIHAVVGENGAGKSTLMGILSGAVSKDAGEVLLEGAPFRPSSPRAARRAGVVMVHQELSLCPDLTVAENLVLGDEPVRFGFLSARVEGARAGAALRRVLGDERMGRLPLGARARELSTADQQLVEIARALASSEVGCKVLILDEPTSSLGAADTERLFVLLQRLAAAGTTVLYISHFLDEVRRVASRFTVLRDGRTVGSGEVATVSTRDLVGMMAGRDVEELFPRGAREPGEELLVVDGLTCDPKPVSARLTLRRGEILGVAGLVGAGRTELLRGVFGLAPVREGRVRVAAWSTERPSPHALLARKVGMLSEDRKGEGLALGLSVKDNVTLSTLEVMGPLGLVLPSRQRAAARRLVEELGIRCQSPDAPAGHLSGGNQQKVALARLLLRDVDVFLLDEPTRGIDAASKSQIYTLLDRLAAQGKAILMVSSYLPELFGVADRIAVMSRGKLGEARKTEDWSEREVLIAATGASS